MLYVCESCEETYCLHCTIECFRCGRMAPPEVWDEEPDDSHARMEYEWELEDEEERMKEGGPVSRASNR